jgi:Signal transduction histidine kinase.
LLADLSFADLVLWAPLRDGSGWVALAQMRPTTGPTTLLDDAVGTCAGLGDRPFVYAAYHEERICREGDPEWTSGIPVRRESSPWSARAPSSR